MTDLALTEPSFCLISCRSMHHMSELCRLRVEMQDLCDSKTNNAGGKSQGVFGEAGVHLLLVEIETNAGDLLRPGE